MCAVPKVTFALCAGPTQTLRGPIVLPPVAHSATGTHQSDQSSSRNDVRPGFNSDSLAVEAAFRPKTPRRYRQATACPLFFKNSHVSIDRHPRDPGPGR